MLYEDGRLEVKCDSFVIAYVCRLEATAKTFFYYSKRNAASLTRARPTWWLARRIVVTRPSFWLWTVCRSLLQSLT